MIRNSIPIGLVLILLFSGQHCVSGIDNESPDYVSYQADIKNQDFALYWKDDKGQFFRSIDNLRTWLEKKGKTLIFAMNAGMYKPGNKPLGLYIENGIVVTPLDTLSGEGNFYLKPNGVFYTGTNNKPVVCRTEHFKNDGTILYATQSGPMLLMEGEIHAALRKGSGNLNIRNGVGLLPDGKLLFAMSKKEVSFYDFAKYFKDSGCKDALYLDGLVSRTYLPEENWEQTDGDFGVIMAVTADK
ncbi:MAG TPA: phosphodiester glycosidase family protein [Chitinophagaceae bacterium]|nr:phosphodiester glycosidase family protein [Chitinophagaceae bacterium]